MTMSARFPISKSMLLALALLPSLGCFFHQKPVDNAEFASINELVNLDGVYENKGESDKIMVLYLSYVFWPSLANPQIDSGIKFIKLETVDAHRIKVSSLSGQESEREVVLFEGVDFIFAKGRIKLLPRVPSSKGAGSPVAGYEKCDFEMGLDIRGNLKYRVKGISIGLVYMMLPFVGGEKTEVRFVKVDRVSTLKLALPCNKIKRATA